jgi:hypothetical protein
MRRAVPLCVHVYIRARAFAAMWSYPEAFSAGIATVIVATVATSLNLNRAGWPQLWRNKLEQSTDRTA